MSTTIRTGFYYRVRTRLGADSINLSKKPDRKAPIVVSEVLDRVKEKIPPFQNAAEKPTEAPGANEPEEKQPQEKKPEERKQITISRTWRILTGDTLREIEADLEELQDKGEIKIEALNIQPETDYVIANQTAKRISIRSDRYEENLVIPPFGSRTINSEILKYYDFIDWERQYLISLSLPEEENVTALNALGFLILLLGLFLVIGLPLAIFTKTITWTVIGITTAVFALLMGIAYYFSQSNPKSLGGDLWQWMKLLPSIFLVLAAGAGLPLAIVYFFGGGPQLLAKPLPLSALGRSLQVSFISIASLLPALLFYLFGRQQVKKQKENFFREVMSLDPNVQSLSEARTKYEPLLDTVYDSGNSPLSILLLLISTSMLVLGWVLTLNPVGPPGETTPLIEFFQPQKSAFSFGFLGAYFFTLNLIFRRYVRADLTPKTYAFITVRFLITVVLVWVVSSLREFDNNSIWEAGMLAIIFIVGLFPDTGLALIEDYVKKIINRKVNEEESLPLSLIEGVNLYDRARLLEEGIENLENLAHHNLIELVARTRIPTSRLVDMFDQAILYLHLGLSHEGKSGKTNPAQPSGILSAIQSENANLLEERDVEGLLRQLKSYGIRTATDLVNAFKRPEVIRKTSLPFDKLDIILGAMSDDEWFEYIKEWRISTSVKAETVSNPYEFYVGSISTVTDKKPKLSEATKIVTNGHQNGGSKTEARSKRKSRSLRRD